MDAEAMVILKDLKVQHRTWEKVAEHLTTKTGEKVNKGLCYQVAEGKTESATMRHILGLPPLPVLVTPCPCGQPHTHLCATGKRATKIARSATPAFMSFLLNEAVPFLTEREKPHATGKSYTKKQRRGKRNLGSAVVE